MAQTFAIDPQKLTSDDFMQRWLYILFKIIIHSKSIKKQQSKDMRPWKQCFFPNRNDVILLVKCKFCGRTFSFILSLKMHRFAECDQIQNQMQIIQNQQNPLSYHNSVTGFIIVQDSLLFQSPEKNTDSESCDSYLLNMQRMGLPSEISTSRKPSILITRRHCEFQTGEIPI